MKCTTMHHRSLEITGTSGVCTRTYTLHTLLCCTGWAYVKRTNICKFIIVLNICIKKNVQGSREITYEITYNSVICKLGNPDKIALKRVTKDQYFWTFYFKCFLFIIRNLKVNPDFHGKN